MKRIFAGLLAVMLCMLCACAPADTAPKYEFNVGATDLLSQDEPLKLLAVGNSFSNDATQYLHMILEAEGVTDFVLGRLYIPGASLATHIKTLEDGTADYHYYKIENGKWVEQGQVTLLDALADEDWNIITMQQSSASSGVADTYNEDLDHLVSYVNQNKTNPDAKLLWHMTWAYQTGSDNSGFAKYDNDQMTMYTKITEAVQQKIMPRTDFAAMMPVGTAIQNMRTSYFGDYLTRDTFHLNDFGMGIAGYTWYAVLTGKPLEKISMTQLSGALQLPEEMRAAMLEAINSALTTPFAVTQSTVTEK